MIAYADTSALAKRYLKESGSDAIRGLAGMVTSALTVVETSSAIWRRVRMGELAPEHAGVLTGRVRVELTGGDPAVIVLPPTAEILVSATRLAGSAGLRAYDAVHLATAIAFRESHPEVTRFACFDRQLATAAAAHGFDLWPTSTPA